MNDSNHKSPPAWYEVAFSDLYPVVYSHRDAGEARRAAASFAEVFAGASGVLDVGCGNGRYMSAFEGMGVPVWGTDLSEFLLRDAVTDGGHDGEVVLADMRRLPFGSESVGGVINMFTSFGYFEHDTDNLVVLQEIARVLKPRGVFLFDYFNAARVLAAEMGSTHRQQDGYAITERKRLESDGRLVVKSVVVRGPGGDVVLEYDERVRLYSREDINTMVTSASLGVTGVFGDYDRGAFDEHDSDRLILVCEKR